MSVVISMMECLKYKPALVITALMFDFFPRFVFIIKILKIKVTSKKVVHELKVSQKVGDFSGNRHSSPQRGRELGRRPPPTAPPEPPPPTPPPALPRLWGGGMGSEGGRSP